MSFEDKFGFSYLAVLMFLFAGWCTNVVWLFQHFNEGFTGEMIFAIIGAVTFLPGALHGIWVWF